MSGRPLRIAMIGQRGLPGIAGAAGFGGVERVVEELGARLAARGHHVVVYCQGEPGSLPASYRDMRVVATRRVDSKHLGTITQAASATAKSLRGFDVIHYHAIGPCLLAPVPRLVSRARIVATVHGRDDRRGKWGRAARVLLRIGAWSSAYVPHATIVLTEALQREYLAEFHRPTVVIRNGVVPPAPGSGHDAILEGLGVLPGQYLLAVGRLVPEKAADLLVEAFGRVRTDKRLLLVGEASHTDVFAERVRLLAARDPRIVVAGAVQGPDVDALYDHAAMFVLPSYLEGLPLVLLEAASHGLPVVASDIAPHREVLGHLSQPGRRLFRTGDRDDLTRALQDVLDNLADEAEGGRKLRDEVLETYDWDDIARQTEALYRQVLAGSPAQR